MAGYRYMGLNTCRSGFYETKPEAIVLIYYKPSSKLMYAGFFAFAAAGAAFN